MGKIYTQPRNFDNSEGVSDTIHKSPSSGEASKHNKNVATTISASGPGNIRVAGEGSYSESRNSLRGVSEQLFLVEKKDGGKPPNDKSEKTQCIHPLRALQKEGLHCLKFLLEQNDFLYKIDLKDTYFAIPLSKQSSKYVRFKWSGNLYEFLCLCFGLEPAPKVFTKLLKIPIALLRRINIQIIVYLDDMLLMARTLQEFMTARDALIFLLQNLRFAINLKKSGVTDKCRGNDTVSLRRKSDS